MDMRRQKRTRWGKFALLAALPLVLYSIISERFSWRPQILQHTSNVYAVAFSSDGSRLTSAQADGKLLVWDNQESPPRADGVC